jgi:hypothetical protein
VHQHSRAGSTGSEYSDVGKLINIVAKGCGSVDISPDSMMVR